MAKVNPQDEKYEKKFQKTPECGTGKKLLAAVGFERYKSGRRGTPMIGVRFLCVHDFDADEGAGDAKSITFDNIANTDAAMWRFVDLAKGLGWTEPFDPDDDEEVGALLTSGYVQANLVEETFQGKKKVSPAEYVKADEADAYEEDPNWQTWIEQAEEDFRGYLEWRAKNPRGGRSSGPNRTDRGRGGDGRGEAADEDIPF